MTRGLGRTRGGQATRTRRRAQGAPPAAAAVSPLPSPPRLSSEAGNGAAGSCGRGRGAGGRGPKQHGVLCGAVEATVAQVSHILLKGPGKLRQEDPFRAAPSCSCVGSPRTACGEGPSVRMLGLGLGFR